MEKIEGLIAAPFTPMDEQGELALHQVETLARLYDRNDIAGAFVCGSTGEGVSLTYEEKVQLMHAWGAAKGERIKTIFLLGGTCLKEMQSLARLAAPAGMDAVAALCPYYFRPNSVEKLVDFCREVASAAPDLPFYYYHIPALSGGHFSMARFLAIAEPLIPNLAGIKFTSTDIMDFHACRMYGDQRYDILWGVDEALLSGLAAGATGAVGSTYNYAAPLYHRIVAAFRAGDNREAEQWQQLAVRMVGYLVQYGGTAAGKAFMKIIGVDCGWFRPPVGGIPTTAVAALARDLETIGFFDFCSLTKP
ncbi:MAG: hypothetical protein RLY31_1219 [Bacteroidota bacterium]|jgi:N-acetylneuraminate lyase